ncbi:MAG: DNA-3-methyladenine glycosylase 2 family protein [Pseudomonadota bacterium]
MKAKPPIDVFSDVGAAQRSLARKSDALKRASKTIGRPLIRRREGGFAGLFRIIVEQQVSVPSAQAIWKRCVENLDCASPASALSAGEEGLRRLGLSSPKARYVLALAEAAQEGRLNFGALPPLSDDDAMKMLIALKGVGPWTASIYLLFCEGRVDIWPPNDVALKHAYNAAAGAEIDQKALDALASAWSPWRGVAAHILWTYYAHLRGRTPI